MEKIKYKEAIILLNNENLESNEKEGAKTLNDFFSNVIKNLEVPKDYFEDNLDIRLSSHPALPVIVKYKNHPKINIIRRFLQHFLSFKFKHVDKNTIRKEIERLIAKKVIQDTGTPVKL